YRFAGSAERTIGLLGLAWGRSRDCERGERRLLLGFLLGAVFVEPVGAQRRTEGETGGDLGRPHRRAVAEIDRKGRRGLAGAVQMRREVAAEILQQAGIDGLGSAEP